MANYQETNVAGTSYVRCNKIDVDNKDVYKAITFYEEQVVNLNDGDVIRRNIDKVGSQLTVDNAATTFPVLNPETGEDSGVTMTYQDVYVALYSLYLHMAKERDNGNLG